MAPIVVVTFVRHGESIDNLRSVWAGWKDAPLSNHGMNQANACGESLSNIRFKEIFASPLKRAYSTALAIKNAQPEPKPPLTSSLLVREQHFGVAEGHRWLMHAEPGLSLEEHIAKGVYPVIYTRDGKFPEGESLDDLGARATQAIEELVMPHVWTAVREGSQNVHIAVVSHGLCISELVPALLRKDARGIIPGDQYKGLLNTAWTRLTVEVKGWETGKALPFTDDSPPPLLVQVTDFNRHEHIVNLKRQQGGIGSMAHDPKQQDIRAFFGGGKGGDPLPEGRSSSNAEDEADVDIQ